MISLPKSKKNPYGALLIISADLLVDFQYLKRTCHHLKLELCKSLEGSGLSEKINLNSSNVCTSCQENLTGSYQCTDCDETLCVKCFKAHSRLKLTRTHIVTPF